MGFIPRDSFSVILVKVLKAKGGNIFGAAGIVGIGFIRASVTVVNFARIKESMQGAQGTATTFGAFFTSIVPIRIGHVVSVSV